MDGQRAQQYYGLSTSVVIPALNEAQNLQYVLPFIPPLVSEVILVDGHSTDDTIAVAKQLLPTIRIVKQAGKGKGNALKAGFAACTGDIIVMLDADGSTAIHYGVTYTPTTFFINRQGLIVRSIPREMTAQELQTSLQLF